jgi:hypothetical protein
MAKAFLGKPKFATLVKYGEKPVQIISITSREN